MVASGECNGCARCCIPNRVSPKQENSNHLQKHEVPYTQSSQNWALDRVFSPDILRSVPSLCSLGRILPCSDRHSLSCTVCDGVRVWQSRFNHDTSKIHAVSLQSAQQRCAAAKGQRLRGRKVSTRHGLEGSSEAESYSTSISKRNVDHLKLPAG